MVFSKKQQYELLASISARGEIPVKFVYLNDGAKRWDNVYKHWEQQQGVTDEEMALLMAHINSFTGVFSNSQGLNLIDLGSGNGAPATKIIQRMLEKGLKVNYIAVDISKDMLDLTQKNLSRQFNDLPITLLELDFEKESLTNSLINLKQQTNLPNLM